MSPYDMIMLAITGTGALGSLAFVLGYHFSSRGAWRKSEAGRFMMAVYACLTSLFLLIIANRIFGDWPGKSIVTVTLFTTYCIFAWWPLRLLSKANRRGRHRGGLGD